jgi:hypothetical protein
MSVALLDLGNHEHLPILDMLDKNWMDRAHTSEEQEQTQGQQQCRSTTKEAAGKKPSKGTETKATCSESPDTDTPVVQLQIDLTSRHSRQSPGPEAKETKEAKASTPPTQAKML